MSKPVNKPITNRDWLVNTTARYFQAAQREGGGALEEFVERVNQRLFSFCLSLTGNKEAAEDLRQELYVKLLKHIKDLRDPNAIIGWLYAIAKNHFFDYCRKKKNKPTSPLFDLPESLATLTPDFEGGVEVLKLMEQLTPEDRFLVTLVYVEGCTYEETADVMGEGITVEAVRSRVYRVKKLLRKEAA